MRSNVLVCLLICIDRLSLSCLLTSTGSTVVGMRENPLLRFRSCLKSIIGPDPGTNWSLSASKDNQHGPERHLAQYGHRGVANAHVMQVKDRRHKTQTQEATRHKPGFISQTKSNIE